MTVILIYGKGKEKKVKKKNHLIRYENQKYLVLDICRRKEIWIGEDQEEHWHLAEAYLREWNFIFRNNWSAWHCNVSKITCCLPWPRIWVVGEGAETGNCNRCPDCPLHCSEWLPVSHGKGAWRITQICRRGLQKCRPRRFFSRAGQNNANEKMVQSCEKLGMS